MEARAPATKIDFLLPSLDGGGAERDAIAIARGLLEHAFIPRLIVWGDDGPALGLLPHEIPVIRLPSRGRLRLPVSLARAIDHHGTDVLVSTLQFGNAAAVIASRISRREPEVVVTVHNHLHPPGSATPSRMLLRAYLARGVYPSATAVVGVSEGVVHDVRRHLPSKHRDRVLDHIPNPVLPRLRHPVEPPPVLPAMADREIVAIGRLTQQKDFATAIEAVSLIGGTNSVHLTILGEGPQRAQLEAMAREMPPGRSVSLPGYVHDIRPYMDRARLFLLSSRWEGLGNVIVEALDAGLPVVATDCDYGPRELLAGGAWGSLIPPSDPRSMAIALERALEEPPALPPPGFLDAFTADVVSKQYVNLIARITSCP